jgi:hypothetical protein
MLNKIHCAFYGEHPGLKIQKRFVSALIGIGETKICLYFHIPVTDKGVIFLHMVLE